MIDVVDAVKVYRRGHGEVRALNGVSLSVPKGQFLSVMGSSGSGKSTMLNLLGALDVPTRGTIRIDGKEISKLPDDELSRFRRDHLGFIFQFFNLLPTLTAMENVLLPALLAGKSRDVEQPKAQALLEQVGLKGRWHHRPDELSGGEMQRVAIARAVLGEPSVLLADEPTGNLDSKTGAEVLRLIRDATRQRGLTVVMVTHDPKAAEVGDRLVRLADGVIVGDEAVRSAA
ncbi:MAG: ABC transporter ATP-binding protein [Myxococcaceae bacterium]|nr:ABC transporter ATP-binding protein [Myxococcaceae bacterium]